MVQSKSYKIKDLVNINVKPTWGTFLSKGIKAIKASIPKTNHTSSIF